MQSDSPLFNIGGFLVFVEKDAMLKMVQIMDIKELHQAGHSIKAIVQLTGISRNTVRKVLRGESSLERKKRAPNSCLDPYKDYITKRYNEVGLSAVRMQEEIASMGYQGSIRTIRRFITTVISHTPIEQSVVFQPNCRRTQIPSDNGNLANAISL